MPTQDIRERLSKVFRCRGRNFSNVMAFNKTGEEIHSAQGSKKIVSLYTNGMYRGVQRISAVRRITCISLLPREIIALFFFRRFTSGKITAAFLGLVRPHVIYRPARRDNLHSRNPLPEVSALTCRRYRATCRRFYQ